MSRLNDAELLLHKRRSRPKQRMHPSKSTIILLIALSALVMTLLFVSMHSQPTTPTMQIIGAEPARVKQSARLYLSARGTTWLEVQTLAGKQLHYGLMQPGQLEFPLTPLLRIRAGRPDLIDVFLNQHRQRLGKVGDIGWKQFDSAKSSQNP